MTIHSTSVSTRVHLDSFSDDIMDESASINIDAWGVELKKGSLHCNFNYVIYLSTLGKYKHLYCTYLGIKA